MTLEPALVIVVLLALLAASACIAVAWPRCAGAVATFDAFPGAFSRWFLAPRGSRLPTFEPRRPRGCDRGRPGLSGCCSARAPVGFAVKHRAFGTLLAMVAVALAGFDGDGDLERGGAPCATAEPPGRVRTRGRLLRSADHDFVRPGIEGASRPANVNWRRRRGGRDAGRIQSASAWVLLGKSNRTFRAPMAVPLGHSTLRVALGDIDGDGRLDALMQRPTESFDVLLRARDGTFDPSLVLGSGPNFGACGIALVDLVGDARPEIVVGSTDYDRISGTRSIRSRTHVRTPLISSAREPTISFVARDVNGDGEIDLTSNNRVWLGAGDGSSRLT